MAKRPLTARIPMGPRQAEVLKLRPGWLGGCWFPRAGDPTKASPRGPNHIHEELELCLVYQGQGAYVVEGRLVAMAANDLMWLPAGRQHWLVRGDLKSLVVVFRPQLLADSGLSRIAGEITKLADDALVRTLPLTEARLLRLLGEDIGSQEDAELGNAGLRHLLQRAWKAFIDAQRSARGAMLHPAVNLAMQRLRAGFTGPLPDLARAAGVSADHLTRQFRREVGCSPVVFRARCALERVVAAYKPGDNLLDAVLEAGFGSYAQFHRVFRQHFGSGPREYFATHG